MGLSHRQVIELILGGGAKVKLGATELAKTSIKRGGRKRVLSMSKQVRKRFQLRRGRRAATSPNVPSSPGPETSDKQPKQKTFWKNLGRRASHSLSPGTNLRRTSSLKRMVSSPDGRGQRPASPKCASPSFDFRTLSDQSSSSVSSSPASSPSSPSTHSLGRPGEKIQPKLLQQIDVNLSEINSKFFKSKFPHASILNYFSVSRPFFVIIIQNGSSFQIML